MANDNITIAPCAPRVHVVIAGAENVWTGVGNKMMFLAQAVRSVRLTSSHYDNAFVAYFSPSDDKIGYSSQQENAFENALKDIKVNGTDVKIIKASSISNLAFELNQYLISIKKEGCESSGVVKRVDIFAHGSPSIIGLVYGDPSFDLDKTSIEQIKPEWFDTDAKVYSWACQTMNASLTNEEKTKVGSDLDAINLAKRRKSLSNAIAITWSVDSFGCMRRTSYSKTWDWQLFDGDRVLIEGKNNRGESIKTVWEPSGADAGVIVADSPTDVPSDSFWLTTNE